MKKALSLAAQDALRKIRALHALPETSGTFVAERRVLNQLNSIDTLDVAMALAEDEEAYERFAQAPSKGVPRG